MDRCTICNTLCNGDTCPTCDADIRALKADLDPLMDPRLPSDLGPRTYDPDGVPSDHTTLIYIEEIA